MDLTLSWMLDGLEADSQRSASSERLLHAAQTVRAEFKPAIAGSGSLAYARLLCFAARTGVALGEPHTVVSAESTLDEALGELEKCRDWTQETTHVYVDAILTLAVSRKARACEDDARRLLRDAIGDPVLRRYRQSWDVIPLFRQEVMMAQTDRAHERLADVASDYRFVGGAEYYGCVKRIFEFVLNNGTRSQAEAVFPLFAMTFASVKGEATPLARISFLKNAAQYAAARKQQKRAEALLAVASCAARARHYSGQVRQLDALQESVKAGEAARLETFRVPPLPHR
jgi:hypothetical protein